MPTFPKITLSFLTETMTLAAPQNARLFRIDPGANINLSILEASEMIALVLAQHPQSRISIASKTLSITPAAPAALLEILDDLIARDLEAKVVDDPNLHSLASLREAIWELSEERGVARVYCLDAGGQLGVPANAAQWVCLANGRISHHATGQQALQYAENSRSVVGYLQVIMRGHVVEAPDLASLAGALHAGLAPDGCASHGRTVQSLLAEYHA